LGFEDSDDDPWNRITEDLLFYDAITTTDLWLAVRLHEVDRNIGPVSLGTNQPDGDLYNVIKFRRVA